ncbi:MAG: hypothetical protein KME10_20395 [Plectolyngbya sp. WJT66-NPBG17]|nr:hypothetical protein [Plectolyngbya sp. WJT66-NPBG17]MBW4525409.1 hypothetical protein [Phormidium tanganyikae FI6-MK23]
MQFSVFVALMQSCWNLLLGYIPALIVGLILGGAVAWNRVLYEIGIRAFQLPASIPFLVYIPVGLHLFQRNDSPLGPVIVSFISVWFIAIYTAIGVRKAIQNDRQWHFAIPKIFLGIRFGLTIAWSVLILAERLVGLRGIGFYIWNAYNAGNEDSFKQILNAAIAVTITAFLLDQLLDGFGILLKRALRFHSLQSDRES